MPEPNTLPRPVLDPGGEDRTQTVPVTTSPRDTIAPPFRPRARLLCVVGDALGTAHELGAITVIGRGHDADLRLDRPDVSRRHARIVRERNDHVVEDLGSRNGTLVNGVPVQRQALRSGDRLQIGPSAVFVYGHHDELEERALRLQRLDALAQLAGGLVHDVRNMLGIIRTNADLLRELLAEPALDRTLAEECLADLCAASDAGAALTRRVLYFARRTEATRWAPIPVGELIASVVGLVRASLSGAARIELVVEAEACEAVHGDRDELTHALVNICLNARDAMPDGGRLTIGARPRVLARAEALALHLPCEGRYLELSVDDTGCGMDAATVGRVFEPFFTTKPGGHGLGLSTTFGVVRHHGGNVFVTSAPGRGTTFRLLLPAIEPGARLEVSRPAS